MGQQQLMLVILVVIIVGFTTIVAINILGAGADNANRDAVIQDLFMAASHAQEIWARPLMLNGAAKDFNNLESNAEFLRRLNIPTNSEFDGTTNSLTNENGTYEIQSREADSFTITGTLSGNGEVITLQVIRDTDSDNWHFLINGEEAPKPE